MSQGFYCLKVTLTLMASSGTVDGVAAPVRDLRNTTQVSDVMPSHGFKQQQTRQSAGSKSMQQAGAAAQA